MGYSCVRRGTTYLTYSRINFLLTFGGSDKAAHNRMPVAMA